MAPCYDNINGTLRQVKKIHDNVGGTLREVKKGYDNVGGTLREYYSNAGASFILSLNVENATYEVWKLDSGVMRFIADKPIYHGTFGLYSTHPNRNRALTNSMVIYGGAGGGYANNAVLTVFFNPDTDSVEIAPYETIYQYSFHGIAQDGRTWHLSSSYSGSSSYIRYNYTGSSWARTTISSEKNQYIKSHYNFFDFNRCAWTLQTGTGSTPPPYSWVKADDLSYGQGSFSRRPNGPVVLSVETDSNDTPIRYCYTQHQGSGQYRTFFYSGNPIDGWNLVNNPAIQLYWVSRDFKYATSENATFYINADSSLTQIASWAICSNSNQYSDYVTTKDGYTFIATGGSTGSILRLNGASAPKTVLSYTTTKRTKSGYYDGKPSTGNIDVQYPCFSADGNYCMFISTYYHDNYSGSSYWNYNVDPGQQCMDLFMRSDESWILLSSSQLGISGKSIAAPVFL